MTLKRQQGAFHRSLLMGLSASMLLCLVPLQASLALSAKQHGRGDFTHESFCSSGTACWRHYRVFDHKPLPLTWN